MASSPIEVSSTAVDRHDQIDECFAGGAVSRLAGTETIVGAGLPAKWARAPR